MIDRKIHVIPHVIRFIKLHMIHFLSSTYAMLFDLDLSSHEILTTYYFNSCISVKRKVGLSIRVVLKKCLKMYAGI